ncbi:MAG TPA: hypothetical protein VND95_07830 [Stellaceae bacterium]|nr:hypothetical protein [Stellaceae bacterium]
MTSKTATSVIFAAACALALGAMPAAQAQSYPQPPQPQPQPYMQYAPQANAGPPELVTNGPQASRGDFGDWSARRNNIQSARYDRLLQTNIAFRHARMRTECGPIADARLNEQCLASFQQYEPVMVGSSMPPRHYRHYRGAGN